MTGRRATLCVVAGPNGSGKTTTTNQLLNNEWAADSLYDNPDNIAQETFGDWNSPEADVLKEQVGIAVPAEAWGTDVLVLTDEQKAALKALADKLI
jgi:predicted ABC-type ATPase